MTTQIAYSNNADEIQAVKEIREHISMDEPKLLLFFASSKYDLEKLGNELEKNFNTSQVTGCTTSGELISGHMLKESFVVMAIDKLTVEDVKITALENISSKINLNHAILKFQDHFGVPFREMDPSKYVGMTFIDGLSGKEEEIMNYLGDLSDILFIGGSAGDDLKFKETLVYINGKARKDTCVLTLIKPTKGYDFIKTQSFSLSGKKLVATKVNEAEREVIEFNNEPAAEAYAKALGTTVTELPNYFMKNPLGLSTATGIFVRSPQQIIGTKVKFYCQILNGSELDILQGGNIVEDTDKELTEKMNKFGEASGVINFNCILRTLELEATKKTEDYAKLFEKSHTVGFSTYGEQFLGHINQTATILLLK